mgnify:CR=1 FL=1
MINPKAILENIAGADNIQRQAIAENLKDPVSLELLEGQIYSCQRCAQPHEAATVAHNQFKELGIEQIRKYGRDNHVLYDIKYIFSSSEVDGRI